MSSMADELPQTVGESASWMDAIQQASERIAALARKPIHAEAHIAPVTRSWDLGLALEAMRQERFDDALALLSMLPAEAERDLDAMLLRAVLLVNSGKGADAETVCSRILAADDLNAGAHYVMALCREHAGDADGALEHDKTAAYLDPTFAMPHLHLGLVSRRSGDTLAARHALSQAITLLGREDAARLLLFGGGFSREALLMLCRSELRAAGGS